MLPIMYTLIAIFLFSLWTMIAAYATQEIGVWEFIFWVEVVAFGTAWFLKKYMVRKTGATYTKINELSRKEVMVFAFAGTCRVICMGCLFYSFKYVSVATAITIYDFWPIVAVYLTPLLVTKDWSTVTIKEVGLSVFACIGLFMLIYPPTETWMAGDEMARGSYLLIWLPFIAGLLQAVCETIKSSWIAKMQVKEQPFLSMFVVDVNYGLFCLIASAVAFAAHLCFFGGTVSEIDLSMVGIILFFSMVVGKVGAVCLTTAILKAKHNIFALWFFLPILTLFWLWAFGLSEITSTLVLGMAIITIANMLNTVRPDNGISYPGTLIMLLLSSVYCFYTAGQPIDDYFEGVATPLIFFVLIVAFLMDRLINRDRDEESLVVELIRAAEVGGPKDKKKKKALIERVSQLVRTNNPVEINEVYTELRNAGHKCFNDVMEKMDALVLSRIQGLNFAEMLVMSLIGILVVGTTMVFRPEGLFGDCFAIILSSAVCFIYLTVIDLVVLRRLFFLEVDDQCRFSISKDVAKQTLFDMIVSVVLIVIVLAAMMGVMYFKNGIGG